MPILSILIPTIPCRESSLKELLDILNKQINALPDPKAVEIKTFLDDEKLPVGDKRTQLVKDANGKYVCFIDDDDTVADTYIEDIITALNNNPKIDCVVFKGLMTTDGKLPVEFSYSIKHKIEYKARGVLLRKPNHICVIRAAIAKAVPFPSRNAGEDFIWAKTIHPYLRTEVAVDKQLYFYRFSYRGTRTQTFNNM